MQAETIKQIEKAIPAVVGAGITLSDVSTVVAISVGIATVFYVLAQLSYLLWKWRKEWRESYMRKEK